MAGLDEEWRAHPDLRRAGDFPQVDLPLSARLPVTHRGHRHLRRQARLDCRGRNADGGGGLGERRDGTAADPHEKERAKYPAADRQAGQPDSLHGWPLPNS